MGGVVSAGRAVCQSSFMWVSSAAEASLSSVLCSSSPRRCDGAPVHLPPGCSPSSDCSPLWEGTSLITGFPNRGPFLSPLPPSLFSSLSPNLSVSLEVSLSFLHRPHDPAPLRSAPVQCRETNTLCPPVTDSLCGRFITIEHILNTVRVKVYNVLYVHLYDIY